MRKDLSFFGSFGKRGLGYSVPELTRQLREILGLGREWRVVIVGAGKIGAALAQYRGFRQRGFTIVARLRQQPGEDRRTSSRASRSRDVAQLEQDVARDAPDIVVLTVPAEDAQAVLDRVVRAGDQGGPELRARPSSRRPPTSRVKTVNMAMELEGLELRADEPGADRGRLTRRVSAARRAGADAKSRRRTASPGRASGSMSGRRRAAASASSTVRAPRQRCAATRCICLRRMPERRLHEARG